MERARLGQVDCSRIVYGMWRLGDDPDTSVARVRAKLDACLAAGITTLDHADIYGGYMGEEILGNAFRAAPGLRDRFEIVTKCGIVVSAGRHAGATVKHYNTSRAHIEASVEASLRLMATDRVELLLIHRPDPFMDAAETGAALDALVRSGKVREVGVSNFRPWDFTLLQSAMETPLVTNQIELSLGARDPFTNGDIAFLQERKLRPMAWSPLGGGHLLAEAEQGLRQRLEEIGAAAGTDWSAVAIAWLLAHPSGVLPVLGTNDPARIARAPEAMAVPMDRQSWFQLYSLAMGREVP